MKASLVLGILGAIVLSIMLPKVLIWDDSSISQGDIACAKSDTYDLLENPFERLLIIKISVDKKVDDTLFTSAYTVGGIKWATVKLVCNTRSSVTWRMGDGE